MLAPEEIFCDFHVLSKRDGPGVRFATSNQTPTRVSNYRVQNSLRVFKAHGEYLRKTKAGEILKSTLHHSDSVTSASCGLTSMILEAYNGHHDLVLRPDDVWTAIVQQFCLYVNNAQNNEQLRCLFVSHGPDAGKKELRMVYESISFHNAPYDQIAQDLVTMVRRDLNDPELVHWLVPSFSTTRAQDTIASAILVLATFQGYYKFSAATLCGIPNVYLLGTLEDWQRINHAVDDLCKYDNQARHMTQWLGMLKPVTQNLVDSFCGKPNPKFWSRVCAEVVPNGSGTAGRVGGWVTAFNPFDSDGRSVMIKPLDDALVEQRTNGLGYPPISQDRLATGLSSVPLQVTDDSGQTRHLVCFAGHICADVGGPDGNMLCPRADWAFVEVWKPDELEKAAVPRGLTDSQRDRYMLAGRIMQEFPCMVTTFDDSGKKIEVPIDDYFNRKNPSRPMPSAAKQSADLLADMCEIEVTGRPVKPPRPTTTATNTLAAERARAEAIRTAAGLPGKQKKQSATFLPNPAGTGGFIQQGGNPNVVFSARDIMTIMHEFGKDDDEPEEIN